MMQVSSRSKQPKREAWTCEHLLYEHSIVLGFTINTTTASVYNSHLNSYITFCQLHNLSIDPTEETLSFYVVWLSHYIKPHSVDSYLLGISNRLQDSYPFIRATHCSSLVAQTLRGCKRRLSKPVRRKIPLCVDDLQWMIHFYKASTDFNDFLFLALLLTGFHTLQ
jgi:hypothetical protein